MYLKRHYLRGEYHYLLCESFQNDDYWKHKVLMDLGPDPGACIEYPGGRGFYIKDSIVDELRSIKKEDAYEKLEELFVPFLRPEIRRIVERYQGPSRHYKRWRGHSKEELIKHHRTLHSFDKRRLHYLRCGRVDMGDLESRPLKFLNVLLEKSRDEIESLFEEMENELPHHEIQAYLYASLQLQTHFNHLLTRHHPGALDSEKVDHLFVEDLCRLNDDEIFFKGVEDRDPGILHPYLIRYLILYFDNGVQQGRTRLEYGQGFKWQQQFFRQPSKRSGGSASEHDACKCLGISQEDFKKMDRAGLNRCFRRLAQKTHPDKGGDQKSFLKIKDAYEILLARKPG